MSIEVRIKNDSEKNIIVAVIAEEVVALFVEERRCEHVILSGLLIW